jgi:hypothetical protein
MVGGVLLKLSIFIHFMFLLIGLPSALAMYREYPVFRKAVIILIANVYIMFLFFLLHDGADTDGLRLSASGVISLIGAAFFVKKYKQLYNDRCSSKLIFDVFLVGVLHAIIILGIMVFLPFGDWMKETFFYTDKTLEYWGSRSPGLSVSGFGVLSLSQAMAGILGVILLLTPKENNLSWPSKSFIFMGLPLILLSIVVSGRTGLVALTFTFFLFVLFNIKLIYSNKQGMCMLFGLLLGIATLLSAMLLIAYSEIENYSRLIQWSLELYFRYEDQGTIATGSTNIVLDRMYFLPEGLVSTLFGVGDFGRLEPALPSDVGYVLIIFGVGVLGVMSMMMVFAYFTYKSIRALRLIPLVANSVLLVTLMLIVANFKDPFFFHIYGTNQIVCILFALMSMALFDYKRGLKDDSFRAKQPRKIVFQE